MTTLLALLLLAAGTGGSKERYPCHFDEKAKAVRCDPARTPKKTLDQIKTLDQLPLPIVLREPDCTSERATIGSIIQKLSDSEYLVAGVMGNEPGGLVPTSYTRAILRTRWRVFQSTGQVYICVEQHIRWRVVTTEDGFHEQLVVLTEARVRRKK